MLKSKLTKISLIVLLTNSLNRPTWLMSANCQSSSTDSLSCTTRCSTAFRTCCGNSRSCGPSLILWRLTSTMSWWRSSSVAQFTTQWRLCGCCGCVSLCSLLGRSRNSTPSTRKTKSTGSWPLSRSGNATMKSVLLLHRKLGELKGSELSTWNLRCSNQWHRSSKQTCKHKFSTPKKMPTKVKNG